MRPLAIDLFCGVGGWTEGLLAEGYDVIGFDIERHEYGDHRYPAQLVLQDVRTLHGSQFRDAALIVASPPCQEFSWMAMPWSRGKAVARALRGHGEFPEGYKGSRTVKDLTALFDACFRIQREASAAAGHHIPLVVENVRGAIPWVGRSRWNYGSYHLWGDVPALMPMTKSRAGGWGGRMKTRDHEQWNVNRANFSGTLGWRDDGSGRSMQSESVDRYVRTDAIHRDMAGAGPVADEQHTGGLSGQRVSAGIKQSGISGERNNGKGDRWFQDGAAASGSKSSARKAASAMIARIPFELARHIAQVYYPREKAA